MSSSLRARALRWGTVAVLAAMVLCAALAWVLTPFPSPLPVDDSLIDPFDLTLCAVAAASFAALAVAQWRTARRIGDAGGMGAERARDLCIVAMTLFGSRAAGYEAASSAGFVSQGIHYLAAPGTTPGWAGWALATVFGLLALFQARLLLVRELRGTAGARPDAGPHRQPDRAVLRPAGRVRWGWRWRLDEYVDRLANDQRRRYRPWVLRVLRAASTAVKWCAAMGAAAMLLTVACTWIGWWGAVGVLFLVMVAALAPLCLLLTLMVFLSAVGAIVA